MIVRDVVNGRFVGTPSEGYKECPVCKKEFHYKRSGFNKIRSTCSKECRYKSSSKSMSKKIPRICVICKKEFLLAPSIAFDKRRGNSGIYCSKDCRWKHKIEYTKKQKAQATNYVNTAIRWKGLQRGTCVVCGNKKTQAHHYKGYAKENWLKIIWLCVKHHNQEHEKIRRLKLSHSL